MLKKLDNCFFCQSFREIPHLWQMCFLWVRSNSFYLVNYERNKNSKKLLIPTKPAPEEITRKKEYIRFLNTQIYKLTSQQKFLNKQLNKLEAQLKDYQKEKTKTEKWLKEN